MIQLTQVAESLIAEMYNRSESVRLLFTKRLKGLTPISEESTAVSELQLSSCGDYGFDGVHKIDVAILDKITGGCIPCEAKLGKDRLGKSEFEKRFLKSCSTSHGNSRISGSMTAILERKLPDISSGVPIVVRFENAKYDLTPPWILIVRDRVLEAWERKGSPAFSSKCVIFTFEWIVRAFGGEGNFNKLVTELLDFNYYRRWLIKAYRDRDAHR